MEAGNCLLSGGLSQSTGPGDRLLGMDPEIALSIYGILGK